MRKTIVLSGLIAVVAGCLVLWPGPSYSASKGRAASPPPGKSTVSIPSRAPVWRAGKGATGRPAGTVAAAKKKKKRIGAELYTEKLEFKFRDRD